jgi:hypothetical protein
MTQTIRSRGWPPPSPSRRCRRCRTGAAISCNWAPSATATMPKPARAAGARTRRPVPASWWCSPAGGLFRVQLGPWPDAAAAQLAGVRLRESSAWRPWWCSASRPACRARADYNSASSSCDFSMRFLVFLLALLQFGASHAQPLPTTIPGTHRQRARLDPDGLRHRPGAGGAGGRYLKLEPASLTKVMTTYLVAEALAQKTLSLQQPVTVSERAWRTQGSRSFVPVNKGVLGRRPVQGHGDPVRQRCLGGAGRSHRRQRGRLRRDDEPHGAAPGPQGHELPQCQRLFRRPGADPLLDRARPRQTGRGADPRPSGNPCPACDEGIHLQRHPPAQPQPPAVGRPDRGWPQDRPFQRRRLSA